MKNKFNSSVLHEGHIYGLDEGMLDLRRAGDGRAEVEGARVRLRAGRFGKRPPHHHDRGGRDRARARHSRRPHRAGALPRPRRPDVELPRHRRRPPARPQRHPDGLLQAFGLSDFLGTVWRARGAGGRDETPLPPAPRAHVLFSDRDPAFRYAPHRALFCPPLWGFRKLVLYYLSDSDASVVSSLTSRRSPRTTGCAHVCEVAMVYCADGANEDAPAGRT